MVALLLRSIKKKAPKFPTLQYCHFSLRSFAFRKRCLMSQLTLCKFSPDINFCLLLKVKVRNCVETFLFFISLQCLKMTLYTKLTMVAHFSQGQSSNFFFFSPGSLTSKSCSKLLNHLTLLFDYQCKYLVSNV